MPEGPQPDGAPTGAVVLGAGSLSSCRTCRARADTADLISAIQVTTGEEIDGQATSITPLSFWARAKHTTGLERPHFLGLQPPKTSLGSLQPSGVREACTSCFCPRLGQLKPKENPCL